MSHSTGNMNNRQTAKNSEGKKRHARAAGATLAEHRLFHHAHG